MSEVAYNPDGTIRSFPCPYCGETFDFPPGDIRMSAPCVRCGKTLVMPHGSFNMDHATIGFGGHVDPSSMKPGLWTGGLTRQDIDRLYPPKPKRKRKPKSE
jgi:hypothetical protein